MRFRHDWYKVNASITAVVFIAFYAVLVFIADRRNSNPESRTGNSYWFDELSLALCIHYLFYMLLAIVADPKNAVSEGLHLPIGPCNDYEQVHTPLGGVLKRSKYFCIRRHDSKLFDFHCIPGGKPPTQDEPLEWYAICGTPFENRAEYITIVWAMCLIFFLFFHQAAARSDYTAK